MTKLVFDPTGSCEHAVSFGEEGVALPKGATSQQLFRYLLVSEKAVDRFAGLNDDEAIAAFDVIVRERLAAAQKAEEDRVRAQKAEITRLDYLRRFTQAERITINTSTDPVVQDFLVMLNAATSISLIDEDTVLGTRYLEQLKLLDAGRADQILAF